MGWSSKYGLRTSKINLCHKVLKYEVFENLTEEDIKYIMNKLGNKIHVKI